MPPPREVSGLQIQPTGDPSGTSKLSWDEVLDADFYHVYRGGSADLSDLTCLVPFVPTPPALDDLLDPPAGKLFLFLLTSGNCGGESVFGYWSDGTPRSSPASCP